MESLDAYLPTTALPGLSPLAQFFYENTQEAALTLSFPFLFLFSLHIQVQWILSPQAPGPVLCLHIP